MAVLFLLVRGFARDVTRLRRRETACEKILDRVSKVDEFLTPFLVSRAFCALRLTVSRALRSKPLTPNDTFLVQS
jgi:hypothetical protein